MTSSRQTTEGPLKDIVWVPVLPGQAPPSRSARLKQQSLRGSIAVGRDGAVSGPRCTPSLLSHRGLGHAQKHAYGWPLVSRDPKAKNVQRCRRNTFCNLFLFSVSHVQKNIVMDHGKASVSLEARFRVKRNQVTADETPSPRAVCRGAVCGQTWLLRFEEIRPAGLFGQGRIRGLLLGELPGDL